VLREGRVEGKGREDGELGRVFGRGKRDWSPNPVGWVGALRGAFLG